VYSFGDLDAGGTSFTAIPLHPLGAVQRLGQHDGRRESPYSLGSGKEEGMREAPGVNGPPQKNDRLSLAEDPIKTHFFAIHEAGYEKLNSYWAWVQRANRFSKRCTISL
jgi:hypothetical protein